jgi:hypothetical protein
MAIRALCRLVRSEQRKCSIRVIKGRKIFPRLGRVASITSGCLSIRPRRMHERVESSLMRICMAIRATISRPVILRRRLRLEIARRLVAVAARNCQMASAKIERGFVVPGQAVGGRPKPLQAMAVFATVYVWCFGKLSSMFIAVAVRAKVKPYLVDRECLFRRNVALCATQRRMLALERIGGRRMLFQPERGRLEAIQGMTGRAFGSATAMGELSSMRIWMVTVGALLKRHRFREVSMSVASHTLYLGMFSDQCKFRLGMVKHPIQPRRQYLVPACCGVAGLARLREFAAVGIGMAVTAIAKRDSGIARFIVTIRDVALPAGNFVMQTCQWIARQRMIERDDVDRFPLDVVVTLQAVGAQPPSVFISMAVDAS